MSSLLQRLRQVFLSPRTPSVSKNAVSSPPVAQKANVAAPGGVPDAAAALVAVAARRPLIAADGSISGFEFCIDAATLRRLRSRNDPRGRVAHVLALLTSARLMSQSGRVGFARLPIDWVGYITDVNCATGAWVGIEQAPPAEQAFAQLEVAVDQVQQLRAAGAKVGWDITLMPDQAPDFLMLHQRSDPMSTLLEATKTWPQALRDLPTLVTDVASVEDVELALSSGISYACGALAPPAQLPSPAEALPLPPEVHRVGHLLNQLVIGTDTAVIVSDIKSDVGLSYRLLRRINSASFAQLHAEASIDQAVLMLGRNELYRWLSLLLVQFAGKRKASSALQEITLWRSRLLELLAKESNEPIPGQLFTLGLASMLGPLLKISQNEVVSTLNLPAPARQALLEQDGPWHVYLHMALLVQTQSLDEHSELAEPFGGVERVMALSDEAWTWAWDAEHANRDAV
jgi:EAL and modified HD-GYP domain-containing signal transduction protein